ncbi:MAG: acetate--CoA ligase family protein, partial [Syntrophales bacterium]|nr:acetate--CoA ligase family protein [Syntrophales bacterium]
MDAASLIARAKAVGRTTLTEAEAKEVLKAYGIPVVEELVVRNPQEALARADHFGFPVVLKGLGPRLTHKTERNAIRMNLNSPEEVFLAARDIARLIGDDLEGFLLQPMVRGRREFVAGMFFDAQFGPVIMFGLGGIFTEALGDVTFRVAPLSRPQAEGMLEELRATALLESFRGEEALRRDEMVACLMGLSRLALDHEEITEVD